MDHDTVVVLIFVTFFFLFIVGLIWVFVTNRRKSSGYGGDVEELLREHARLHKLGRKFSDPASPMSPGWRKHHRHDN